MKYVHVLLFAVLINPILSFGQYEFIPGEKDLIQLQEQRSTGGWRLSAYLKSEIQQEVFRALLAIANIQAADTVLLNEVRLHLTHPSDSIRSAAAFTLGQCGYQNYDEKYFLLLKSESSVETRKRMAEAVGKSGSPGQLTTLIRIAQTSEDSTLQSETAIAIMRAGMRGIRLPESFTYCLDLVSSNGSGSHSPALYALWRTAPHPMLDSLLLSRRTQILAHVKNREEKTRYYLSALLGRAPAEIALPGLTQLLAIETNPVNEQNLTQLAISIATHLAQNPSFGSLGLRIARIRNDNILSSFALALAKIDTATISAIRPEMISLLKDHIADVTGLSPVTRGELLVLLSRFNPRGIDFGGYIDDKKESEFFRAKALEAAAVSRTLSGLELLIKYQVSPVLRLGLSAWGFTPQAIASILGMTDLRTKRDSLIDVTALNAITAIRMNRMPLTLVVSTALADPSFVGHMRLHKMKDSLVSTLVDAFAAHGSPRDAETRISILRAITSLDREKGIEYLRLGLADPEQSVVTSSITLLKGLGIDTTVTITRDYFLFREREWSELDSIPDHQQVILHTNEGKIKIELYKRDAPVTVMHFLRLSASRFYQGTIFHRVVPNFVIQGGDPFGVGMGGPDYRLRTEISLTEFSEGMVGMASSGRDTEGSQFFITSLPARHLDGRYTLFGRVVEGMDVVQRIQIGDTIERAEILGQRR